MAETLDNWLPVEEVEQILQVSRKTVNKYAREGVTIDGERFKLRKQARRFPGRPPLPVYHPEDVEKVRRATVPIRRVPDQATSVPMVARPNPSPGHIAGLPMIGFSRPAEVCVSDKLYLSLKEASAYSGLSTRHLSELLRDNRIHGFKRAGWKVQRASLEQFAGIRS